jgi:hypothetical protein
VFITLRIIYDSMGKFCYFVGRNREQCESLNAIENLSVAKHSRNNVTKLVDKTIEKAMIYSFKSAAQLKHIKS